MSISTIFGLFAVSLFALMIAIAVGWAIVKTVSEIAGCDDDPEDTPTTIAKCA